MDKSITTPLLDEGRLREQLDSLWGSRVRSESRWNLGYPLLTEALRDLESGLVLITAPENVGKSAFLVGLGEEILGANQDVVWVDFSLDDGLNRRLTYMMSRHTRLSMTDIRSNLSTTKESEQAVRRAYREFESTYRGRYHLLTVHDDDVLKRYQSNRFTSDVISRILQDVRSEIGAETKLLCSIDGFHDVVSCSRGDELAQQKEKADTLKIAAEQSNAVIAMTAHSKKNSRARGLTADIIKGDNTIIFHAVAILHLYSEVNMWRDEAELYWIDQDNPDAGKRPILEVDILKNKAGDQKRVLFFESEPRFAWQQEAPAERQELYRGMLQASRAKG